MERQISDTNTFDRLTLQTKLTFELETRFQKLIEKNLNFQAHFKQNSKRISNELDIFMAFN